MASASKKQVGENSNIDIFIRIRPVAKPSANLLCDTVENKVDFAVPRSVSAGCAWLCCVTTLHRCCCKTVPAASVTERCLQVHQQPAGAL